MAAEETYVDEQLTALASQLTETLMAACDLLKIDDFSLCHAALTEVTRAANLVDDPTLLAPGFARHGYDHSLMMAQRLLELLKSGTISLSDYAPGEATDVLLLTLTSFVYHDIGMMMIPAEVVDGLSGDATANVVQLWRHEGVRDAHHTRSLEYIERLLMERLATLTAWQRYWRTRDTRPPKPYGKYELLTMARICQSHGDIEDWLKLEAMGNYSGRLTNQTWEFAKLFGPAIWAGGMQRVVCAAACLLNLCDLLDIRSSRMDAPLAPLLRAASTPVLTDNQRLRYLHWLGNKYTTVSIENGSIGLELHGPEMSRDLTALRLSLLDKTGPGGDLVRYGRSLSMTEAFRECFADSELSVIVRSAAAYDWTDAEAMSKALVEAWPRSDLNRAIRGSAAEFDFDEAVTLPMWYPTVASAVATDGLRPLGLRVQTAHRLRVGGIALEDVYDTPIWDERMPAHVVVPGTEGHHYRTDSFIAAIRLARCMAASDTWADGESPPIRIACKPNPLFSALSRRGPEELRAIVLVAVESEGDRADFNAMVAFARDSAMRLIFFARTPELAELLGVQPDVMRVPVQLRRPALDQLARRIQWVDITGNAIEDVGVGVRTDAESDVDLDALSLSSPGDLVHSWLQKAPSGLTGVISDMLADNDNRRSIAQGAILLLTLAERRALASSSEADVSLAYERARRLLPKAEMPSFSEVSGHSALSGFREAFRPEAPGALRQSRLEAMDSLDGSLDANAQSVLLVDALISVANGEVVNPAAIEWDHVYSVLRPAIATSLPNEGNVDSIQLAAQVAIPLVDMALEQLDFDARLNLARWISMHASGLESSRGMVCFQLVYRLLRDDGIALQSGFESDSGVIMSLGCLEAVCSYVDVRDEQLVRDAIPIVNVLCGRFVDMSSTNKEAKRCAIMAFDILYTYRVTKSKAVLIPDSNVLWDLGVRSGWLPLAEAIRRGEPLGLDGRVYADLRIMFDALQRATPIRYQRESNNVSSIG